MPKTFRRAIGIFTGELEVVAEALHILEVGVAPEAREKAVAVRGHDPGRAVLRHRRFDDNGLANAPGLSGRRSGCPVDGRRRLALGRRRKQNMERHVRLEVVVDCDLELVAGGWIETDFAGGCVGIESEDQNGAIDARW